ncbi:MAG: sulfotransferase [Bacteroidota bacterium]
MMRSTKKWAKAEILRRKSFRLEEAVLIISSPRGGSTWLGEIINHLPGSLINWEPFHPKFGVLPTDFNWGDAAYLPEALAGEREQKVVEDILNYRRASSFSLSFASWKGVLSSRWVITKSVRTTCLLPWIVRHIPLKRKPIYLLRHPIPTALSHLKAFGPAQAAGEDYQVPDMIHNDRFREQAEFMNGLASPLERQVAIWCLNNLPSIRHAEHGRKWIVQYYEDLVLEPEQQSRQLLEELGFSVSDEQLSRIKFRKASQTDMKQDLLADARQQLEKWQHQLSDEQVDKLQKVFDHFDLKLYSAHEPLPLLTHKNKIKC